MRKILLIIPIFFTVFLTENGFSQQRAQPVDGAIIQIPIIGRLEVPAEYTRQHLMGNNIVLAKDVQGSPYLTESFLSGQVLIDGREPYRKLLRYNAYLDEIQMKDDQNKTMSLLKREYIRARIAHDFYEIVSYIDSDGNEKKGYMVKVEEGNASLYRQNKKLFIDAKEAPSSYRKDQPAKLVEEMTYFLRKKDGLLTEMKFKKKEVLKMLGDKDSELKKYLSENNNIALKNEVGMAQLIRYYNTL